MRDAGLDAYLDYAGNLFGVPAGAGERGQAVVLAGSHIDTVPMGGTLDGALGVVAAIETAQALRDAQRALLANPATRHPFYWAGLVLIGDWR